jgi:CheY-like chemotaxis protein
MFRIQAPDVLVHGDKLLLQQIISNLVSNAIQYTEGGHIDVKLDTFKDCLSIEVSDTGCGIHAVEQQQIFNQFFRSDRTRALHDGLGLGLSIVKRLCDLMGADIQVFSQMGQGSQFVVKTPFTVSTHSEETSPTKTSFRSTNSHQTLIGKYIAVIEDNPIIAEAYKHTLASKGAHVLVLSENAQELDSQLETIDQIDCILCDFRLSQTTGDLLIEKIRESYNEEIPAIIVTADTSPSHINLFTKLNVQVLHKPVSFQAIAQVIEKILPIS